MKFPNKLSGILSIEDKMGKSITDRTRYKIRVSNTILYVNASKTIEKKINEYDGKEVDIRWSTNMGRVNINSINLKET